jgi:hypothetical protein
VTEKEPGLRAGKRLARVKSKSYGFFLYLQPWLAASQCLSSWYKALKNLPSFSFLPAETLTLPARPILKTQNIILQIMTV